MNRLEILDIPVDSLTMVEVISLAEKAIINHEKLRIVTANAEMIMQASQNKELKRILLAADLVVPDGAGVVWASRQLKNPVPERVAGADLAVHLLQLAAERQFRVYFLGASPHTAEQAAANMIRKFPLLNIVGTQDGFFSEEQDLEIIQKINESQADLLLVALGSPKQEVWLEKWRKQLTPSIHMGVGGTLDVMAGNVQRAPLWMQKNSLEWLYRGLCQPSRWRRLLALPRFVLAVKRQKGMDNH